MHRVIVFGGDGFCGWPISLRLSNKGYAVTIVDNLSRRSIDDELGCESLTPIRTMKKRTDKWAELTGNKIYFRRLDIATNYHGVYDILKKLQPHTIVHLAEQRAAPYSMKDAQRKRYTVTNNIIGTHNLLVALTDLGIDAHVVHIGSMGSYGYNRDMEFVIPEGYVDCTLYDATKQSVATRILYPADPGSVYHMTKVMDAQLFHFYNKNDRLRITDLYQGIVWGTQTAETKIDPDLINRFDYDGDYGTVLNRFLVQAIVGHPITVYGSGDRVRAFIHLKNTVDCVQLAIENPPQNGAPVQILNQTAEQRNLHDLAILVHNLKGAPVGYYTNPRIEEDKNKLKASNSTLIKMGLTPIMLNDADLMEVCDLIEIYKDRANKKKILSTSLWRKDIKID